MCGKDITRVTRSRKNSTTTAESECSKIAREEERNPRRYFRAEDDSIIKRAIKCRDRGGKETVVQGGRRKGEKRSWLPCALKRRAEAGLETEALEATAAASEEGGFNFPPLCDECLSARQLRSGNSRRQTRPPQQAATAAPGRRRPRRRRRKRCRQPLRRPSRRRRPAHD